jgi:hypothetical protein
MRTEETSGHQAVSREFPNAAWQRMGRQGSFDSTLRLTALGVAQDEKGLVASPSRTI